jgi:predicted MFS family arabinose efflux permease
MDNRWVILVILFFARTAMGFQHQAVASVSSLLIKDLNIDYARLGTLIGIYQLPGVVLAFPGGLLGNRFGDKRVVVVALGLMAIGGFVMGGSSSYSCAVVGRLISGTGAVLVNVLLTKMVADWFAGREIVTAMAILVSSWPLGIGLALLSLGRFAQATSWLVVMHLTAVVSLVALVLVTAVYPNPVIGTQHEQKLNGFKLSRQELCLVLLAGLIWTLFNVGFVVLPSFGTEFLTTAGYTIAGAGSLISVVTWTAIPSVQVGGYMAERIGRPNRIMVICFLGIGLTMCLLSYGSYPLVLLIVLGLLFGRVSRTS